MANANIAGLLQTALGSAVETNKNKVQKMSATSSPSTTVMPDTKSGSVVATPETTYKDTGLTKKEYDQAFAAGAAKSGALGNGAIKMEIETAKINKAKGVAKATVETKKANEKIFADKIKNQQTVRTGSRSRSLLTTGSADYMQTPNTGKTLLGQ